MLWISPFRLHWPLIPSPYITGSPDGAFGCDSDLNIVLFLFSPSMMILCATCLHAVPDDLERCPFCSEEIGAEHGEIDERIEWRIVRTVSTEIEARLIAGRLRANGIPAFVLSQVDSTRNFTVGALAVAKVFVPEELLPGAETILALPADDPEHDNDFPTDQFNA